jgi:hypothetical protein
VDMYRSDVGSAAIHMLVQCSRHKKRAQTWHYTEIAVDKKELISRS